MDGVFLSQQDLISAQIQHLLSSSIPYSLRMDNSERVLLLWGLMLLTDALAYVCHFHVRRREYLRSGEARDHHTPSWQRYLKFLSSVLLVWSLFFAAIDMFLFYAMVAGIPQVCAKQMTDVNCNDMMQTWWTASSIPAVWAIFMLLLLATTIPRLRHTITVPPAHAIPWSKSLVAAVAFLQIPVFLCWPLIQPQWFFDGAIGVDEMTVALVFACCAIITFEIGLGFLIFGSAWLIIQDRTRFPRVRFQTPSPDLIHLQDR